MNSLTLATLHRKVPLTPVHDGLSHFLHGQGGTVAFGLAIGLLLIIVISGAIRRLFGRGNRNTQQRPRPYSYPAPSRRSGRR